MIVRLVILIGMLVFHDAVLASKPYNTMEINQADLRYPPQSIDPPAAGVEVTLGDLHGNALKLLYFLVKNDIVSILDKDYSAFANLYKKPPEMLSRRDLNDFHSILNRIKIKPIHKIRLLGDDLCDRGMNDYYTLALYEKLDKAGVPFEILLSNHGQFFLRNYENKDSGFLQNPYGEGKNESTVQSMLHLGLLIKRGLVNQSTLLKSIETHYIPHLIIPAYTLNRNKNEITIYSHAPIDLNLLSQLAADLNLSFNDLDLESLAISIDAINVKISQWMNTKTLTAHYDELNEQHKKSGTLSPLAQFLWNRNYTILQRQHHPQDRDYYLSYVHGHDSMPNVFNLDNLFGKGEGHYEGAYAVHKTHD